MRIRDIVKILNVDKTMPIHYMKKVDKNNYAWCKHATDEELNDYRNNCWSKEKRYDVKELGIYIPDITVEELCDFELERNPVNFRRTIIDISYMFFVPLDKENIIFATFVILHEVGHWLYFKNSGMSSLDYMLWDSKHRREPIKYCDMVKSIPDNHPMKYQYAEKGVEMYKNIPAEKEADEYALKHLRDSLVLLGIDI